MIEQAQLPPHTPAVASSGAEPFNMAMFASELKSTPKQDYSEGRPDAEAEQPGGKEPPPATPSGDAGDKAKGEEGSPNMEGSAKETARVVLMMYDNIVSQVCCAIADRKDYPATTFKMDEPSRKEAERQLAIGIEKNNWVNLPWWAIMALMLVASGVANWLLVREARKKSKEEREAKADANRAKAAQGKTLHPDSIIHPDGREQPLRDQSGTTAPRSVTSPAASQKMFGPCQAPGCNNLVKHRGRKFCSQSCSGKATSLRGSKPATATA